MVSGSGICARRVVVDARHHMLHQFRAVARHRLFFSPANIRQRLIDNKFPFSFREALTALRRRARTTKTSVPSPFESMMKEIEASQSRPLVKEICATCGNHDSKETTWMTFPGTDIFAKIPFHAAHTILEKDQSKLDYDAKKLQSYVKEKSFWISEQGVLADKIGPGVLKSMVTLTDKPK